METDKKIALCFYGQPRDVSEMYNGILTNLIEPNNIQDIFIHMWWRPEFKTTQYNVNTNNSGRGANIKEEYISFVEEKYKPLSLLIENDSEKSFHNPDLITNHIKLGSSISLDRLFPSFYSRYKTFDLLKQYEIENNIKYDIIIIIRFDTLIKNKILLSELDLETLNFNSIKWNSSNDINYVSDFIIIGNRNNMEVYSETYNCLPDIAKRMSPFTSKIGFFPEAISGNHLIFNQIKTNNSLHTPSLVSIARNG